jgi:hypothetical protein
MAANTKNNERGKALLLLRQVLLAKDCLALALAINLKMKK